MLHVFRILAGRLTRYRGRPEQLYDFIKGEKNLLNLTGNQALPKNKPADNWVGAVNLISHVTLTLVCDDSKEINFPKQFTTLAGKKNPTSQTIRKSRDVFITRKEA